MAQLTLKHIRGNTYYIPAPANIGIFVEGDQAVLIDSGNDKEAGRQILRLLNEHGWNLKMIINTHSNADHIGGNAFLQQRTECRIAAPRGECGFIENPLLEPAFLFGGFPHKDMKNKFLMAKQSTVTDVISEPGAVADSELKSVHLPGHFFDMVGIITPDNVFFIADSLFPENIINKYHLFFLFDIKAHLETLERLKSIAAEVYVPGHGKPLSDLHMLIELNNNKVLEIMDNILGICAEPVTSEEVLEQLCGIYKISLDLNQYLLLSNTIRSYLSCLYGEGRLEYIFTGNMMKWKQGRDHYALVSEMQEISGGR